MIRKRLIPDMRQSELRLRDRSAEESRRYYVALWSWFLLAIVGLAVGLFMGIVVAFGVAYGADAVWHGGMLEIWRFSGEPQQSRADGQGGLLLMIIIGLFGLLVANICWYLLFVRSGYLSSDNALRLFSNSAPHGKGENARIAIGYLIYLMTFFGLGISLAIFGDRTPLQLGAATVFIGLGTYYAIHASLRYRKLIRRPRKHDSP